MASSGAPSRTERWSWPSFLCDWFSRSGEEAESPVQIMMVELGRCKVGRFGQRGLDPPGSKPAWELAALVRSAAPPPLRPGCCSPSAETGHLQEVRR